eukprot:SRR837773.13598.p1 GENE.SRR837773.13598~~SRR837773.13598.p1  ORF type:complete len:232 (-),score=12.26 SRR837773.13598:483-1178(-)
MIAGMVKSLLTDRQKQKLIVLRDVKELRKFFALHQLEEDLGGSRPSFSEFYPFPLQPGPFESGYAGGADLAAVPHVHKALTADAAIGRLWDPEKSWEDNVCIEFSPEAEPILERCGVSLSPSPNASPGAASWRLLSVESGGHGDSMDRRVSFGSMHSVPSAVKDAVEASTEEGSGSSVGVEHSVTDKDGWEAFESAPEIEASMISSSGRFGCSACFRTSPVPSERSTILSL